MPGKPPGKGAGVAVELLPGDRERLLVALIDVTLVILCP
jgi:hypothetical protein